MNRNNIVLKCCICGREKTEQGWQYAFQVNEPDRVYSYACCSVCYDTEVMKAKLRHVTSAGTILN